MRYVTIPPDALITGITKHDGDHPTITFAGFVREVLVGHEKVTENDLTIGLFIEIGEAVVAPVGAVVELTNEQHELLVAVARTFKYSPEAKISILPLVKAITGAATKCPDAATARGNGLGAEA